MSEAIGTGENGPDDGLNVIGEDFGLWVPGVDYLAGWRAARDVADRLNRALLGVGVELSEARAIASTNDDGCGVVRLVGPPGAMDRLAGLLEAHTDGDGGAW
ncbi:hypothetical protein ABZ464_22625 [Streptomyces sp. NPDC005820]|uniref:hypothetical protein n=1 Tax=Streptomyces sp. NPDC005820 TaxID=3157069 RepID=UPI0033EA5D51